MDGQRYSPPPPTSSQPHPHSQNSQLLLQPIPLICTSTPPTHSPNSLGWSISNSRVSGLFLLLLCFIEVPVFNANSVDPDQMPCSVASDLGLHCLPDTVLGVSQLKWVSPTIVCYVFRGRDSNEKNSAKSIQMEGKSQYELGGILGFSNTVQPTSERKTVYRYGRSVSL